MSETRIGCVRTALGLMSGTSMDGIDIALVRSDGRSVTERGPSHLFPYEASFRRRLASGLVEAEALTDRDDRPGDLADLERELTDRHASSVDSFCQRFGLTIEEIDLIGFHGQTVLHRPERALTVQLGDGKRLAGLTGIATIADMRASDMVHGGQGAPLVPAYHSALASLLGADDETIAFVNIGGIANVTFVRPGEPPLAFDCGPGNALIDQWMQEQAGIDFDQNGTIASEGRVIDGVLNAYLSDPFFEKNGPKSLDRNDFTLGHMAGVELHDGAATLARLTATAILEAAHLAKVRPKRWIIAGGGARNAAIVHDLRKAASQSTVETAEQCGLSGDMMEAEAWAYLAIRSFEGLPLTWPTTTGVEAPVTGGVLHRPEKISPG
ncbi:anhydro-N-acetylmuramic acid kinase [Notoacmeibacter sp. MSK16QG-6]|uniref:anhydro-N-acetylmuramic acid kinase n=1 Tax=Notoacmeibacter sp. MSK16QG-6 TaxID=2957982 RepID=UPI00209CEB90|nr:anhydro-N-acetylmuramic acid kinase [Notoacmeibacter sp. MSK16QG-6]MCP1197836.1 anhydro-N-acetylmuramic acid kinase [Notoacmeibacter sp. MSK16QG-6]